MSPLTKNRLIGQIVKKSGFEMCVDNNLRRRRMVERKKAGAYKQKTYLNEFQ